MFFFFVACTSTTAKKLSKVKIDHYIFSHVIIRVIHKTKNMACKILPQILYNVSMKEEMWYDLFFLLTESTMICNIHIFGK